MTNNLKFKLLDSKSKQIEEKGAFLELFETVFDRSMKDNEWEHFYLNSPFGRTISFSYFDEGSMVAHGAIIPQCLQSSGDNKIVDYYLQTAVMVKKEYQNIVLFKELMDKISEYVIYRRSFILAFPNEKSYLPFIKLLKWKLIREYDIFKYGFDDFSVSVKYVEKSENSFRYDLYKLGDFLKWRKELNDFKLVKTSDYSLIYKDFEDSLEILDIKLSKCDKTIPIRDIAESRGYNNVNIAECFNDMVSLGNLVKNKRVGNRQRMTIFPAANSLMDYSQIKPSLLLSDVF